MDTRVSTKTLIGQIIRNFGIKETIYINSFIEWIGEAVGEIGYGAYTELAYEEFEVIDFRVPRPEDMIALNNVYYNGVLLRNTPLNVVPKRLDTDSNVYNMQKELLMQLDAQVSTSALGNLTLQQAEALKDNVINIEKGKKQLDKFTTSFVTSNDYYFEETYSCIKTNVEEGFIVLQYTKFALDEDGSPSIIDTFKYREAVSFFVLYRLLMQGYKHPVLGLKDVMELKDTYMRQARNEHKKMTNEQLANFKRNWANLTFNL